jgi:hypothetical protein
MFVVKKGYQRGVGSWKTLEHHGEVTQTSLTSGLEKSEYLTQ